MITLDYLNLITSEHRDKPRYIAMLTDMFDMYVNVANSNDNITSLFDLSNAKSNEVDIIGEIVGFSRELNYNYEEDKNVLDDDDYRLLLKGKILKNSWNGTIGDIYKLWNELFPDFELTIYDNQDMTCTVFIRGEYTDNQYSFITNDLIIPKPAGVSYNYISLNAPLFAYDYDNIESEKYKGYDEGYWSVFGATHRIFALDYDNDLTAAQVGLDLGEWLIS